MAARRVRQSEFSRAEAVRLRTTLEGSQRTSATDPLRVRRDAIDERIREIRSQLRDSLVESVR